MLGQIPENLGLSESEQTQIHEQWSTYGQVLQQIQQEGFVPLGTPPFASPGYIDQEAITSQDSRVLTILMAQYKAWRDYSSQRAVFASQILTETRNELRSIETTTKRHMREASTSKKAISAADVKDEASRTPRYTQLLLQEQQYVQLDEFYSSESSRFSSGFQLLSRTVTIRGQDIEQNGRAQNVGTQGPGRGYG